MAGATVFHYVFVSKMLGTDPVQLSRLGVTLHQYIAAVVEGLREVSYNREFWYFVSNCILQVAIFRKLQSNTLPAEKWWS